MDRWNNFSSQSFVLLVTLLIKKLLPVGGGSQVPLSLMRVTIIDRDVADTAFEPRPPLAKEHAPPQEILQLELTSDGHLGYNFNHVN